MSAPDSKNRPAMRGGADSRKDQQDHRPSTSTQAASGDAARRLADALLVRDYYRAYVQGMRAQANPRNTQTIAGVDRLVLDAEIDYARAYVDDLFARHGIDDRSQARRHLRERCTDSELFIFRECLSLLDGQGCWADDIGYLRNPARHGHRHLTGPA